MEGTQITFTKGKLIVPANPIIPLISGDGIGQDITPVVKEVVDAAVKFAYKGKKKIYWLPILAGKAATDNGKEPLPKETLDALKKFRVSLKGPLETPVGKGMRSLNVAIRQKLDLYACVRPVRYFQGVPSPMREPEKLNVVIYRENTEDVYAGYEWKEGSSEAKALVNHLNTKYGTQIAVDAGIGIKPISKKNTQRLVRAAIEYALAHERTSVTLVHKGNIMKYTEGAFREWGYELAKKEFAKQTITQEELGTKSLPKGKVLIKDVIADSMFQQMLLRPNEYDVLATPNLNGDYLSDAAAAQVGGIGIAPGGNVGNGIAVFEATHGTAPKHAGQDKANPGSMILSAAMMLEYLGWKQAAQLIEKGLEKAIAKKTVTYDFHRMMKGAKLLSCSQFGKAIINGMK